MGLRTGYSRATRTSISRYEDILEGPRRRRLAPAWDPDSEEDEDIAREMSREGAREREVLYRQHAAEALFGGDLGDDDRSIAAIRGMVAGGKRVISKEALASLESVKVIDLKEVDRTCIICYNEFGVSNPEGEIENPIRLPKCKHVFGDKCIKKWFEDSDSCPYCRDKLPSELAVRKGITADRANQYRLAHREQLRQISLAQREQLRTQMAAQRSRYSYAPAGMPSVPVDSDGSSSATAQQVQDDYDFMMARQAETWLGGRNGTGDSPERRRQARGRHAHTAIRAPHFLGNRPTSVGSARLSNTSFTYQPPNRYTDYGVQSRRNTAASGSDAREPALEREVGEARESPSDSSVYPNSGPSSSSESSGSADHTPPRNSRLPPSVIGAVKQCIRSKPTTTTTTRSFSGDPIIWFSSQRQYSCSLWV
ncbi:hypothetical protein BDZ45DRAFT_451420 [Acephala macrosclerotiorum]|nr:hypothetical protein BDZ45DRAFT_451420 [Acephala macrosclerotiorum]